MRTSRLVARRLLDPRPAEIAATLPIRDSVNIPLVGMAGRMHELPPVERLIEIADVDRSAREAIGWLTARGRSAVCVSDFERGCDDTGEIGRLWEPTAFLGEVISDVPGETALELACGTGRDAAFLASRGWRVVGVDWLPDALERAGALATRCAGAIEPIEWRAIDLEAPDAGFAETFDLITVFRFLHRPLIPRLAEWLTPGGVVVYETFTTVHRERHGKPGSDAHVLRPGELAELFAGYAIEHVLEGWRGTAHTARLVAHGRPSSNT